MQTTITKEMALAAIASLPRLKDGKAIFWKDDVNAVAKVAAYLLQQADIATAIENLGDAAKASKQALAHFTRGNDPMANPWPALRDRLEKMGVERILGTKERIAKAQSETHAAIARAVESVAPVAVPPQPTTTLAPLKSATLAVTSGGQVNWRVDPDTHDILVTTTKRLVYGTPEHKAKILELSLQLGAARVS